MSQLELREEQVIEFLTRSKTSAIVEEVAYHFTGEGKQSLFNPAFNSLEKAGVIRKTGEVRKTSNGGEAAVYTRCVGDVPFATIVKKFTHSVHGVTIAKITYEEAVAIGQFLTNPANRDVAKKSANVTEIAKAMTAGTFNPCSMIMFAKDATLLDGHHRIMAQILSKTDQTYVIQVGAEMDWVPGMDVGKRRSSKDTAQMKLRLGGNLVSGPEAQLASSFATHMMMNSNRIGGVTVTGGGIANSEMYEWVGKNEDVCISLLREISRLRKDLPDFKEAMSSPLKRMLTGAFGEMYVKDPIFAVSYIQAVFGRLNTGVFSGQTPVSVKSEFLSYCKKMEAKSIARDKAEREMYTILVNGHNVLKAVFKNRLDNRFKDLKGSSSHLLKKDAGTGLIQNTRRAA